MTDPTVNAQQASIPAIETKYAGCRFRSRLEARWAVFFDALGIRWEYEPEGFVLPSGRRYLPDFWIECDTWVEVKGSDAQLDIPTRATLAEAAKSLPRRGATEESGPTLLLVGPIPEVVDEGVASWMSMDIRGANSGPHAMFDLYHFDEWRKNTRLWWVDATPGPVTCQAHLERSDVGRRGADRAYIAARSARFEFGEAG